MAPPGDIRAYDVVTGKLVWQFHTVPHPGEFGYDTWPKDAWKYVGGANNWGEISIDAERGIAYFPTGSPTYDYYGADRHGANLFGDSLLALDARTGKRLWHFQMVHHDLWDYDNTAAPQLTTITPQRQAASTSSRRPARPAYLYVFDRVTGEPIWPIEERPVPASDMPGEKAWPTQPIPDRAAALRAAVAHRRTTSTRTSCTTRAARPSGRSASAARATRASSRRPRSATPSRFPARKAAPTGAPRRPIRLAGIGVRARASTSRRSTS